MTNLKYLIYTNSWSPNIGGYVTMHKICNDLNTLGQEAYITGTYTHPLLNAPKLPCLQHLESPSPQIFHQTIQDFLKSQPSQWVVIYPSYVSTNPLNSPNVVRVLLHANKILEIFKYAPMGLLFSHTNYSANMYDIPVLRTHFIDYTTFVNRKQPRKGSAHLIRKGVVELAVHPPDSLLIDPFTSDWSCLSHIFNKIETFYSYDNETFLSQLAALCGCTSIVVPKVITCTSEQIQKEKQNFYARRSCENGIAYGIEDVDHAIKTKHLVNKSFRAKDVEDLKTIKNFIKICEKQFT